MSTRIGSRVRQVIRAAGGVLLLGVIPAACDNLLEVKVPSRILATTLDDPANGQLVVDGAVSDFECALASYAMAYGLITDELDDAAVVPYAEVPGFPRSTVHGHRGELAVGQLAGQPVAVMRGRFHFYEGYTMQQVTFPVRVLHALGCATLIVTNACGGLRPDWAIGDLMQIADQIFLPGMAGHHPLIGPNDERLGTRFPAMVGFSPAPSRCFVATAGASRGARGRPLSWPPKDD